MLVILVYIWCHFFGVTMGWFSRALSGSQGIIIGLSQRGIWAV